MSGNWKQMIQEKIIEAAAITLFNYVPGLVAKGFTSARNWIKWMFGGRNEVERDWVGKIGEVAEKAENVLAEYERKELMSWMGRQRMTSTVAELGEIEEKEESHEFCPGAGDPRVVGNERRSVSSKRKERGYYNSNSNDDLLMIMPSRGLEEDPQRFCTYKYGEDGRFTLICSTTSPQFQCTYPGTLGSVLTAPIVTYNYAERQVRLLTFEVAHEEFRMSLDAGHGTGGYKIIHIVNDLTRPYYLTAEAWADSSSRRWTFAFSVLPLPFDFDEHKFLKRARKLGGRKGWNFWQEEHGWACMLTTVNCIIIVCYYRENKI